MATPSNPLARALLLVVPLLVGASPDPAPPVADPRALSEHFLVILSSKLELGHHPDGLTTITAHPELGASPARLSSTAFKALMPCYEVVIAGHHADKAAARALSKKLQGLGVDHYVKSAGAYVGARPELDDYCAALRSPDAAPDGLWFGEKGFALDLPASLSEELIRSAPPLRASPPYHDWSATLTHRSVDRWTIGDPVTAITRAGAQTCSVTGFSVAVHGTPHFGYTEGGTPTAPGCGSPRVYADLDCDPVLVLPAGRAAEVFTASTPKVSDHSAAIVWAKAALKEDAPWAALRTAMIDDARTRGVAREESLSVVPWISAGPTPKTVWVVSAKAQSGEGMWYCGGEDVYGVRTLLLDARGQVLVGADSGADPLELVVDTDADGVPELVFSDVITGSRRVVGTRVDTQEERPYCDCPC